MKIKKILENWNNAVVLQESMKMPEDLPLDTYVGIFRVSDYVMAFKYVDEDGNPSYGDVEGLVEISKDPDYGHCYNAWMVTLSVAEKGWGPMLYDVAIEWASQRGGGLMSDRTMVSSKAQNVWEKYLNSRSDVQKVQLDDLRNTLTPKEEDNCSQQVSKDYAIKKGEKHWKDTPLAKAYKKKNPAMIKKLSSLNKLIIADEEEIDERKERVVGGLADYKDEKDFDPKALQKGIKVEYEHTNDYETAKEIAMDHLVEDPKYYDKLATIEKNEGKKKCGKKVSIFIKR